MIEQVAKAIYHALMVKNMDRPGIPISWEEVGDEARENLLTVARAAIEKMQDPTDEMCRVGLRALKGGARLKFWGSQRISELVLRHVYIAMTRQALRDAAEPAMGG